MSDNRWQDWQALRRRKIRDGEWVDPISKLLEAQRIDPDVFKHPLTRDGVERRRIAYSEAERRILGAAARERGDG